MRKFLISFFCISQLVVNSVFANDNLESVRTFLMDVMKDNQKHIKKAYSKFADKQTPRATVVMCSDSRIQNDDFKMHDVNDLFVVRNIGNQIRNGIGSVEYGVHFLKTPVLLIVGHSGCGAIKAIVSKTEINNPNVERELESLHLHHINSVNEGILENINHQVEYAINKFKDLIKDKKLVVIGAVDDFQNVFGKGVGRFIIVNVNGENDPKKLIKNPYFKEIDKVTTLDSE